MHALLHATPSERNALLKKCDSGNPICGDTHRPSSIVIMETRMWSFTDLDTTDSQSGMFSVTNRYWI